MGQSFLAIITFVPVKCPLVFNHINNFYPMPRGSRPKYHVGIRARALPLGSLGGAEKKKKHQRWGPSCYIGPTIASVSLFH